MAGDCYDDGSMVIAGFLELEKGEGEEGLCLMLTTKNCINCV